MNVSYKKLGTLVAVLVAGLIISSAYAGGGDCGKGDCGKGACSQKGGLGLLGGCHDCGCKDACKVCRLVEKPLTRTVTCYKCEHEPICLPGPSKRGCRNVECVSCDDHKGCKDGSCGQKGCGDCGSTKKVVWWDWNIGGKGKGGCDIGACGGKSRTKIKLMKKEMEVEIKGATEYKWEVVDLCKGCEQKSKDLAPMIEGDAEVPPPPAVEARMIYGKPVVKVVSNPQ
jgi:hypothetical protein